MRIEVGYGLEGTLTDAISKVIIATAITPRFKAGDYTGGIGAGIDALTTVLTGEGSEWQDRAKARTEAAPASSEIDPDTLFLIIIFGLVLWSMYRAFTQPSSGRRLHRTRSGDWISIPSSSGSWGGGWSSGSSSGGGFSGGGGSSGGGGASGDW
jgi:uncharacterized protein